MQRVLLSDRCLYHGGKGISRYLQSLLAHWPADAPTEAIGLVTHRLRRRRCWPDVDACKSGLVELVRLSDLKVSAARARRSVVDIASNIALRLYDIALVREARRGHYSCCFEPNNLAVLTGLPTVAMMHDLSVLEHPQWHPPQRVRRWRRTIDAAIAATDHWIVPSGFTRGRMVELLGVPSDRITVIAEAARTLGSPPDDQAAAQRSFNLPDKYLLHVGTIEPRKGLDYLLDSYALLPRALRRKCPLVLAGSFGWGGGRFVRPLVEHNIAEEVLVCTSVSDSMLGVLLAGAVAVVVPSYYEGFGLVVLEAMAAGTAVICSSAGALAEVADDSACIAETGDVEGWSKAMARVAEQRDYREDLQRRGLQRSKMFSWDRAASEHIELFTRIADSGSASR